MENPRGVWSGLLGGERVDVVLGAVPGLWQAGCIDVVCRRPMSFEELPGLSDRVRGAFGRRLREGGAGTLRTDGDALWTLLFESMPLFSDGLAPHRPAVLSAIYDGSMIRVRLMLLGAARRHLDAAAHALVAGLEHGIAFRPDGAGRHPLTIEAVTTRWIEGLAPPPGPEAEAHLHFLTPLSIRARGRSRRSASGLVAGLVHKVAEVLPMMGLRLTEDSRREALALAEHVTVDDAAMTLMRWKRHSIRQHGRSIPMEGLIGRATLSGPLDGLWPVLALGTQIHGGGMGMFGLGRYAVAGFDDDAFAAAPALPLPREASPGEAALPPTNHPTPTP